RMPLTFQVPIFTVRARSQLFEARLELGLRRFERQASLRALDLRELLADARQRELERPALSHRFRLFGRQPAAPKRRALAGLFLVRAKVFLASTPSPHHVRSLARRLRSCRVSGWR